jgi:hypothetical protein
MFSIHMVGVRADARNSAVRIGEEFPTLEQAIARAEFVVATTRLNGARPSGFRVMNESRVVVHEARR